MATLPASIGSAEWHLVTEYAKARIEELTETCISVGASNETRLVAAHRIEELRDLLSAPTRAKNATEHKRVHQPTEMY